MSRIIIAAIIAVSSLAILPVSEAEACINSIERTRERANAEMQRTKPVRIEHQRERVHNTLPTLEAKAHRAAAVEAAATGREQIATAIDELNDGFNRSVIQRMYDAYGLALNQWALNPKATTEVQREVVHLVALATLRTNGVYYRDWQADLAPPNVHGQNIKWAVIAMENLAFVNAIPERHRAEAWAHDPALQDAALAKFETLVREKRLESPFQFRAFARLLEAKGRHAEASEARRLAVQKAG